MKTYYEILDIDITATQKQIRSAYLRKVKKYHPDVFKGDYQYAENMMKSLNEAYDILSDDVKRKTYDETLKRNGYSQNTKNYKQKKENNATKKESQQNSKNANAKCSKEADNSYTTNQSKNENNESSVNLQESKVPCLMNWFFICFFCFIAKVLDWEVLFGISCVLACIRFFAFDIKHRVYIKGIVSVFFVIYLAIGFGKEAVIDTDFQPETSMTAQTSEDFSIEQIVNELYINYFPVYFQVNNMRDNLIETGKTLVVAIDGYEIVQISRSGNSCYGVILTKGKHQISVESTGYVRKSVEFDVGERNGTEKLPDIYEISILQKSKWMDIEMTRNLEEYKDEKSMIKKYKEKIDLIKEEVIPIGQYQNVISKYENLTGENDL